MASESFNLTWNDFETCTRKTFHDLISDQDFTDVTLVCVGNKQIKAHKVILSASSPFFRDLLLSNPQHPNPLVYLKGVQYADMLSIIQFIYLGQTQVEQNHLENFMETAKELEIQGLIADKKSRQEKPEGKESEVVKKETIWIGDQFQSSEMVDTDIADSIVEDPENENHEAEDDSFQLSQFNPIIENYGYMNNHQGTVQRKRIRSLEKKHSCDQCDYRSIFPQRVREHKMSMHEGIKFSCDLCDKVYSHPNNLRTHKKTKH